MASNPNPTGQILGIKQGQIQSRARERQTIELGYKRMLDSAINEALDKTQAVFSTPRTNMDNVLGVALVEAVRKELRGKYKEYVESFQEMTVRRGDLISKEEMQKVADAKIAHFRELALKVGTRSGEDYLTIALVIFDDPPSFMRENFTEYLKIRKEFIDYIDLGLDADDFFEPVSGRKLRPVEFEEEKKDLEEPDEIIPEFPPVGVKQGMGVLKGLYGDNNKKSKPSQMGGLNIQTQQNLDNFVVMRLRENNSMTQPSEPSFDQANPSGARRIFTWRDIHTPIDLFERDLKPLESFYKRVLKKETDVWLIRDYGDAREERLRKQYPINNSVEKIFDGILNMEGDVIAETGEKFPKIAEEIAGFYEIPDEKTKISLVNLLSQACGFLYGCLSVHGPNLLKLSEVIFNKRSGVDSPNIPAFLNNLSQMGNIHAEADLLVKLRHLIVNELSTLLKVGEHSFNGKIYGLFGMTYMYTTLYEEEGRLSSWSVVNNFARVKVLSNNQWRLNPMNSVSATLKIMRFETDEIEEQIKSLLTSRVSSESLLISYIALVTCFCDVEQEPTSVIAPKSPIEELIRIAYGLSRKNITRGISTNATNLIVSEMLLEVCVRILPIAIINNYKYYALSAKRIGGTLDKENPLIKYVKYCGLNIEENIGRNGTFTKQAEIIKTTNNSAIMREGHYYLDYNNTFVGSLEFEKETMDNVQMAFNALKILNHISIFTPLIPKNIGNIFTIKNETRTQSHFEVISATLVEYLTAFANVLYRNPPRGKRIYSIVMQYEVGATLNREFMSDSITLGAVEVLNVFRDRLFRDGRFTESNNFSNVFESMKLKIFQYTEFVKGLGNYFNSLSSSDYDSLSNGERIKEWVTNHLAKYKNVMGSEADVEFTELIMRKLSAGAEGLNPHKDNIDINELIEQSDGSFYIFTWIAANAKAHKEKLKRDGDSGADQNMNLEISFVGRAKFTVNMVTDASNSISNLIKELKENNNAIATIRFGELAKFLLGDDDDSLLNDYSRMLDMQNEVVESLPLYELNNFLKMRDEEEIPNQGGSNTEQSVLYIDQLKAYNLFSSNSNDIINWLNKGYLKFNIINTPVEYFDTTGVPCTYFALWYHIMLNKIITSDAEESLQFIKDDITIESIFLFVQNKILKMLTLENENESPTIAHTIDVYCKDILTPEIAFNKKTNHEMSIKGVGELIENAMLIEREVLLDNMGNNSLYADSFELNFWGFPLVEHHDIKPSVKLSKIIKSKRSDEHFIHKHKSIIVNPTPLLKNMYMASTLLSKTSASELVDYSSLKDVLGEDQILFKDVVNVLSNCVGDSISDFLLTLRHYNMMYDSISLEKEMLTYEGIVYMVECNSWLITNANCNWYWVKATTTELMKILPHLHPNNDKKKKKPDVNERRFVVYSIEKNHLSVLTPKESLMFIKRKFADAVKSQVTCYTLSGKTAKRNMKQDYKIEFEVISKHFTSVKNLKPGYSTNEKGFFNKNIPVLPSMLCAWDIESYTGDKNVQMPYVISLIVFTDRLFYLASEIDPLYLEENVRQSVILTKSFIGENCVDEFVNFLMFYFFNNTCEEFTYRMVEEVFLFTFNGTKFDHPIVIKKLLSTGCDIIGQGINNPKSIVVSRTRGVFNYDHRKNSDKMRLRKLVFNDFLSLHPTGSLASVCKSLFPNVENLHKSKFDIGGLTKDEFITKLRPIVKYCEQDCLALMSCILVNRVNTTKLIYKIIENTPALLPSNPNGELKEHQKAYWCNVVLPWQFGIYHLISATAWTFEIFKTYFLPFYTNDSGNVVKLEMKGEPNDMIHSIVKSTYRGGLTVVYTEEYRVEEGYELEIYDINSSYPDSMSKGVPFYRFKSVPEVEEINDSSELYDLDPMALYWVEEMDMSLFDEDYFWGRGFEDRDEFKGVNPQRIYPFAVTSAKNKIKELGLIYPAVIKKQWLWGHEINVYVDTISNALPHTPKKYGDIFHKLSITRILKQDRGDETDLILDYNPNMVLKPFVTFFYEMKRKCKVDAELKPLENLFKLFLNGLYGKFGQKEYPETSYCFGAPDLKELSRIPDNITIKACGPNSKTKATIYKVETKKPYKSTGSLVRVASYISMVSRMKLWSTMVSITSNKRGVIPDPRPIVYYCDTDSIFVAGGFPKELIHDSNLGAWKAEDSHEYVKKFNPSISKEDLDRFKIECAFFIAPKCYGVFNKKLLKQFRDNVALMIGEENVEREDEFISGWIKTKGVSKGRITIQGFIELIVNKQLIISQLQFRRSLGQVFVDPDFQKTISLKYRKRVFSHPLTPSKAFYDINEFEDYVLPLLKNK